MLGHSDFFIHFFAFLDLFLNSVMFCLCYYYYYYYYYCCFIVVVVVVVVADVTQGIQRTCGTYSGLENNVQ